MPLSVGAAPPATVTEPRRNRTSPTYRQDARSAEMNRVWVDEQQQERVVAAVRGLSLRLPISHAGQDDETIRVTLHSAFRLSEDDLDSLGRLATKYPADALAATSAQTFPYIVQDHLARIHERLDELHRPTRTATRQGLNVALAAITAAYGKPWCTPEQYQVLRRCWQRYFGPDEQRGLGPHHQQVAGFLLRVQGLSDAAQQDVVTRWSDLGDRPQSVFITRLAAAGRATGRLTSMLLAADSLDLLVNMHDTLSAERRQALWCAANMHAAGLLLVDVLDQHTYDVSTSLVPTVPSSPAT